jgi:sugar (pentulose or hexulose) kinase
MQFAAEKVRSTGNQKVLLTERGTTFGYQDLVVDFRSIPIMKKFAPVIMDCTHSLQQPNQSSGVTGGKPELIATIAKAAMAVGADGLSMLPFGNGAERILNNVDLGAQLQGLNFNRHSQAHLIRAGLEGIAFAFVYGMGILQEMGLDLKVMRVGNDNLFQSRIFAETIATLCQSKIEMLDTTGAVGAAKGAGFGAGLYGTLREALGSTPVVGGYAPLADASAYEAAYQRWLHKLSNK